MPIWSTFITMNVKNVNQTLKSQDNSFCFQISHYYQNVSVKIRHIPVRTKQYLIRLNFLNSLKLRFKIKKTLRKLNLEARHLWQWMLTISNTLYYWNGMANLELAKETLHKYKLPRQGHCLCPWIAFVFNFLILIKNVRKSCYSLIAISLEFSNINQTLPCRRVTYLKKWTV